MSNSQAQAELPATTAATPDATSDSDAGIKNEVNLGDILSKDAAFLEEAVQEIPDHAISSTESVIPAPAPVADEKPADGVKSPVVADPPAPDPTAQPNGDKPPTETEDEEGALPKRVRTSSWKETDRKAAAMVANGTAEDLSQALKMLGVIESPAASAPAPVIPEATQSAPPENSSEVKTVAEADALIEKFENDLKKAGEAYDLNGVATAQIELRRAERKREQLIASERVAEEQQIEAHDRALAASQAQAAQEFPDATNKDSRLFKEIIRIRDAWKKSSDPRLYDANAPLELAKQAAENIGYDPKAPAPATVPVVAPITTSTSKTAAPSKATPHNPPLASGSSRVLAPAVPQREEMLQAIGQMPLEELEAAAELAGKLPR